MVRSPIQSSTRLLNHAELIYAPGERALARDLFRAIGCRVLDPQEEAGPDDLGPAAGPYLVIFVDPESTDLIDNVIYASEVPSEQWRFEQELRSAIASEPALGRAFEGFERKRAAAPQAMTHLGIAMSEAQLDAALERLASPRFAGRVAVAGVYRPGGPGSVDCRVIQAFLRTDVVATSLLLAGQQIELQVRLD